MALAKIFEYDCDVRGAFKSIHVRKTTIIKDGTEEVSRNYHRHVIECRDKSSGSWADTDISGEDATIQAVCNAVWTSDVKTAYETYMDAQESL